MSKSIIKEHLLTLLSDYADFNTRLVERHHVPTPADFAVQVSKGYPRIYHAYNETAKANGSSSLDLPTCPAMDFDKQDWLDLITEPVEVAVTPNGRADDLHAVPGLTEEVFLTPANIQMSLADLFDTISAAATGQTKLADKKTENNTSENSTIVHYLQSQNSNLTTHSALTPLLTHSYIPATLPFAHPALPPPEAVNIWIGDARSTTSLHRDPYENLYLVLKGSKKFTLYPPVDEIVLPTRLVRTGRYTFDVSEGRFGVELDGADGGLETVLFQNADADTKANINTNTDSNTDSNTKVNTKAKGNTNTNTKTNTATNTNTDTGTDTSTKNNTAANTDRDTNTNTKARIAINTDTKSNTNTNTNANKKANTTTNTKVNTDTRTNTTINADTYANTTTNTDTTAISNTKANTNTNNMTNAGTETDTNTSTNTDTNTDTQPNLCTVPRIPWITRSPSTPRVLTLTLHAGDLLYLPSGWFHHVTQQCGVWRDGSIAPCIAVNWWCDMEYEGERYVMRTLLGRLVAEMREMNQDMRGSGDGDGDVNEDVD